MQKMFLRHFLLKGQKIGLWNKTWMETVSQRWQKIAKQEKMRKGTCTLNSISEHIATSYTLQKEIELAQAFGKCKQIIPVAH